MSCRETYLERSFSVRADPLELAARLAGAGVHETYVVYERDGEWGVALGTAFAITVNAHCVYRSDHTGRHRLDDADPIDAIESALASIPLSGWRAYGTASFEFAYILHDIDYDHGMEPLLQLCIPPVEVRLRHGSALVRVLDADELDTMVELVTSLDQAREHEQDQDFDVQVSSSLQLLPTATLETSGAARYKELVRKATQEIADRKLQKVIASRTVPVSPHIDIIATYVAGRRQNSPARSFVANLGDLKLAGFSPETVLEVNAQGRLTTQPLAGTRALVADEDENARLEAELLSDTKELAEHAISVKLAFEELGHVCEDGSVTVCEFMSVSRRGTVQHLASRLAGMLRADTSAWRAFQVLFPAVTASGIPKREAVDWIRRHETDGRSLYSGAVLTVSDDGAMDVALVLRSIFQRGDTAWLRAGAGIVEQSTPDRELQETCEKLRCVARHLVASDYAV